ncbi:MAG: DUF6541 family protein [Anaerolineales bacterium]
MSYQLTILGQLLAGAVVLVLPGLALSLILKEQNKDLLDLLSDAVGLSVALTATLALWANILGWRFSSTSLVVGYLIFGLLALVVIIKRPKTENRMWILSLIPLSFVVILLFWRLYQASDLLLPAWVDSLHHVLIVNLFLENGGIPNTLEPYLPVPFYYHFGFHSLASVFAVFSGFVPHKAVLVIGQVINAAVALSVYRLGLALWEDWRRAGLAAMLVGFASTMPAYYVSWGRYTLLIGLVLLPLAMAVAVDISQKGGSVRRLIHLALLTGGLLLSHYFAAVLFAVFLVVLGTQIIYQDIRKADLLGGKRWFYILSGGIAGLILVGVWIVRMWGYVRNGVSISLVTEMETAANLYFPNYLSYLWSLLGPIHNYLLIALAGMGLLLAFRETKTRAFAFWSLALVLMSQPWGLNISPFRPDHAVIVLFLPITLLASKFLISSWERLKSGKLQLAGNLLVITVVLLVLVWGTLSTRELLNPTTILATSADLQALEWIDEHVSQDARFFINVTYWQSGSYRGVDGGWWITPLIGRDTLLPPVIYIMGERDYVEGILAYAQKASLLDRCGQDFRRLLEDANLTHVYLNKASGSLTPLSLEDCAEVALIYERNGIYLYEVVDHTER